MSDEIKLFCLAFRSGLRLGHVFEVSIPMGKSASALGVAVKSQMKPYFQHVAANALDLWKVNINLDNVNGDASLTRDEILKGEGIQKLEAWHPVSKYWPSDTQHVCPTLRVLVLCPPIATIISNPSTQSGSSRSDRSVLLRDEFAPRAETVSALYQKLCRYGYIHVCGTPASGKTTLALLLFRHIKRLEANTQIYFIENWSVPSTQDWQTRLAGYGWKFDDGSVLMLDGGQLSYWDTGFWNSLIKTISADPGYYKNRVIVFSSYGCPSGTSLKGTPPIPIPIPESRRVTLCPIDHKDGTKPVGLFLTQSEFEDFFSRRYPAESFRFDQAFLLWIFELAVGHVGAILDLIRVIVAHDAYCALKTSGGAYTKAYHLQHIDPLELLASLDAGSIFRRGLPMDYDLQKPIIGQVLNAVCRLNVVSSKSFQDERHRDALQECFRNGWLHADLISIGPDLADIGYVFASPLHRWFVERKLCSIRPVAPPYTDVLRFTCDVIRLYSPRNLSGTCKVGPGCIQRPPEAQYQDEYYRRCHILSEGSTVTFPEFGTGQGRVDFYIPTKKWGVELLRDGNKLAGHGGRFSSPGQYTKLDIDDYIVLDFRTSRPCVSYPSLRKLYHVVFSEDFRHVEILDNNLKIIPGGDFLLLNM